jgi:short-subunit dehydrogenase
MLEPKRLRVFLTGASGGIGLAITQRLIVDGYEVWGTSRDLSRAPQLTGFHPVCVDLLDLESIRRGFSEAQSEAGGFDVLINNAGAGVFGPSLEIGDQLVKEQYQVLVFAPMELIRLALPAMKLQGSGKIINVTSLAGVFPIPFMASYSAAKAALSVQTSCLRMELSDTPIHVIELEPGDINTNFHGATVRVAADNERCDAVWEIQRSEMQAAPGPELVAAMISSLLGKTKPPQFVTVGGLFQARIAPLLKRLVPRAWLEWGLSRFFGL